MNIRSAPICGLVTTSRLLGGICRARRSWSNGAGRLPMACICKRQANDRSRAHRYNRFFLWEIRHYGGHPWRILHSVWKVDHGMRSDISIRAAAETRGMAACSGRPYHLRQHSGRQGGAERHCRTATPGGSARRFPRTVAVMERGSRCCHDGVVPRCFEGERHAIPSPVCLGPSLRRHALDSRPSIGDQSSCTESMSGASTTAATHGWALARAANRRNSFISFGVMAAGSSGATATLTCVRMCSVTVQASTGKGRRHPRYVA